MSEIPSTRSLFTLFNKQSLIIMGGALLLTLLSAVLTFLHSNAVFIFLISAAALSLLAALVGDATDQLGARLGSGATGVLQSALGNLPELFVSIFALRAGLLDVVRSALIGSILGNSLFVLGIAFIAGGLRHGTQSFSFITTRMITTLTVLAVSALAIPTLVNSLHTPASGHEEGLSIACAIILLIVFIGSIPLSLQDSTHSTTSNEARPSPSKEAYKEEARELWPLWVAIVLLIAAGIGSAFVSDWFVSALTPAIQYLHLSQAFTGLVIVALAGNAVENVVGVQFALRNKMDFAISVILNSSLQVALGLTPLLVILSLFIGGAHLTLVFAPLLVASLVLSALLSALIINDGKSTWLEGMALVGLYAIIAIAFWWG